MAFGVLTKPDKVTFNFPFRVMLLAVQPVPKSIVITFGKTLGVKLSTVIVAQAPTKELTVDLLVDFDKEFSKVTCVPVLKSSSLIASIVAEATTVLVSVAFTTSSLVQEVR